MSKKELDLEKMILEYFKTLEEKNKEVEKENTDVKMKIKMLGKHPLAK